MAWRAGWHRTAWVSASTTSTAIEAAGADDDRQWHRTRAGRSGRRVACRSTWMCGPSCVWTKTPRCDSNEMQSTRPPHRAASMKMSGVCSGAYRPRRRRTTRPCRTAVAICRLVRPASRRSLVDRVRGREDGVCTRTGWSDARACGLRFEKRWILAGLCRRGQREGRRVPRSGRLLPIPTHSDLADGMKRGCSGARDPRGRRRAGQPDYGRGRNPASCSAITRSTSAGSAVGVPSGWGRRRRRTRARRRGSRRRWRRRAVRPWHPRSSAGC